MTILAKTAPASALLPQNFLVHNPSLFYIKALITAWHYILYLFDDWLPPSLFAQFLEQCLVLGMYLVVVE